MSVCTGSGIVLSDIPSSDRERDAWKAWNTDRKRAAIRTVLHRVVIKPLPAGWPATPGSNIKDKAVHREREMASSRQRVEFDWRVLGARRPCRFSGRGS